MNHKLFNYFFSLSLLLLFSTNLLASNKVSADIQGVDSLSNEEVLTLDHDTGNLVVSAFNNGTIGANKFNDTNYGSGISWKGTNGLWRSGPVFGSSAYGFVNGQSHNYNPSFFDLVNVLSDFTTGLTSETEGEIDFDQVSFAVISDSAADNPFKLDIIQKVYSKTGEDVVFYRYGFVNDNDTPIPGTSAGVFVDYDVEAGSYDYTQNQGGLSLNQHLAYQYTDINGPYFGVVALNGLDGGIVTANDVATAEELRTTVWDYITNITDTASGVGDQRTWIGTEVGTIEAGDTAWVTFAFVAGDDLGGIINNARNAFTVGKAAGFTDIEVGLKNEEITALDHNTGNLVVSAFNNGTIGANKFNDTNYGSGISWKGYNGLWRSGPVFGSSAYSFVNGQSHNYNPSFFDLVNVASDFSTGLTSEIVGDVTFDQTSLAVISDSNAANPFKLDIIQKVYSKTGEDVVFYRYGFVNDNPTPIPGTSAGVFVDYDVEAGSYDYTQNQGGLSLGQHLAYQYTDVNGPYFGIVALNGLDGGIVTANDVATEEELRVAAWNYITNITDTSSGVGDQRTWIGTEIGTIEAGDTAWVTFAFVAGDDLTGIINNARNAFTIGNAAGFTDIDVSLKKEGLMTLDHNTGNIVVSAFNNGTIGANKFDGTNFGSGIEWKGTNGLWRSGPVFGTTWSGTVNGQSHNYNPSFLDLVNVVSDFASGLTSEIVGDITFDQTSLAIISDSAAANLTNLDIIQKVYSKTGEDAVFYRYGYVNNTDSAISGFSGGVFVDYDVETSSTDYLNNQGGFVVDTHLAYQFADATGGYYGVVAINGLDGGTITSTDVGTEEELRTAAWGYISSLDQTDPGIGDQRTWIGTEVGTIEVGDTAWVTFAFVAGDDLAGITKNAKNAFVIAEAAGFTEIEVGVEKNDSGLPIRFELSQNYPNPFNPSTTIKYSIPANNTNAVQTTKIVVYDILGKEVQTIVNEKQSAGHYEVSFDAGNLSSGVYFYRIQHGEFVSSKKMMLLK